MAKIFALDTAYFNAFKGVNLTANGITYTVFDYLSMALGQSVKIVAVSNVAADCGDIAKRRADVYTIKSGYWGVLGAWVLANESTVAAKYMATLIFPTSALKSAWLVTAFGTVRANMVIPVNDRIGVNFADVITDNVQLVQLNATVRKNFVTVWDSAFNGISATLAIYDDLGVSDTTATLTVSDGIANFALTPTKAITDGFLMLTGVAFSRQTYNTILNRNITLQEVYNSGVVGVVSVSA